MKEIILTQGKSVIVPDAVVEFLMKDKWFVNKYGNNYYAVRDAKKHEQIDGKKRRIYMHRVIWEYYNGPIPDGFEIDHDDHNGLNDLIENLKCVPHNDNMKNQRKRITNKSGYPGVHWHKKLKKWCAYIKVNYKRIHLYWGDSYEEAKAARIAGKLKYHGKSYEDSL